MRAAVARRRPLVPEQLAADVFLAEPPRPAPWPGRARRGRRPGSSGVAWVTSSSRTDAWPARPAGRLGRARSPAAAAPPGAAGPRRRRRRRARTATSAAALERVGGRWPDPDRRGPPQVLGQDLDVVDAGAAGLDGVGDPEVQAGPAQRRESVEQHLAHEGVGEAERRRAGRARRRGAGATTAGSMASRHSPTSRSAARASSVRGRRRGR